MVDRWQIQEALDKYDFEEHNLAFDSEAKLLAWISDMQWRKLTSYLHDIDK